MKEDDPMCFSCSQGGTDYVDAVGVRWHWECFLNFDAD